MTRMARRLRAALSSLLALALVVLSPGLEAPRLFAQVIGRAASVESVRAVPLQSGAAPSAAAMTGVLPALSASPLAAPSALSAAPAAALPEMAKNLAPHLAAAAKPETSASGSAAAGRGIEDILTGRRSAGAGDLSAVAGAEGVGAPSLAPSFAAAAPSDGPTGVPAASAPAEGKTVSSEASYRVHRFLLKTIAALTGAVNSLPVAGPALTEKLIARAADKRVVLSDYDDTLAHYNVVLPGEMVDAVRAVRAAGKDFAVISDRGDEKRGSSLTVFDSLESLPVELRAGMYVAANSGGRVYRYDAAGVPVRVFELPALSDAQKASVGEAVAAVKTGLDGVGTEAYAPAPGSAIPAESWNTYGYALMLKVGSSKESVVKAAELFQVELAKRGLNVEVSPRFAKDAANPPYINFSIVTKAPAAEFIAKALKAETKDVLILGDSMYSPKAAKKASWLSRLGARLSGRDLPATGNHTDRNMEKALPGALTLSVGTTGDPRASNLWVLAGKGPDVTRRILMSVASKTRAESKPKDDAADTALTVTAAAALVLAAGLSYYAAFDAFGQVFRMGEELIQNGIHNVSGDLFLGGILAAGGAAKKTSEAGPLKKFLAWLGLASLTAGIYAALYYAMAHAPAAVPSSPVPPFSVPQGWEGLFGGTLGGAGLSRWLNRKKAPVADPRFPTLKASVSPASPIDGFETFVYAEALTSARTHAAALGYRPDNLRLTGAYLSPRAWGEDWTFAFVAPRENETREPRAFDVTVRRTMVSETQVDAFDVKDFGRSGLFVGIMASALPEAVKVSPMDVVRRFGDQARTLELQARWTGKNDAAELWYVLRGDKGRELSSVNARTGAVRVPDRWASARTAVTVAWLIALSAVLYGSLSYLLSHAGGFPLR